MFNKLYTKLMVLFELASSEVPRCKKCKSIRVGTSFKIEAKRIRKWYHCRSCGRDFWSEEKIYDNKPKWFKNKNVQ